MRYGLGTGIEVALRYLQETDFKNFVPERYYIDGDRVYAMVQEYDSKPKAEGFYEAHRKYLDVQYVAAGVEYMDYAAAATLQAGPYDEDGLYEAEGDGKFFFLRDGYFCILAPQDAHMPGMAAEQSTSVKKVVVKVKF